MTSDEGALGFAECVLALLDRGSYSATYKYAVLMGLIDLCIERSGRHGEPPSSVTTGQLAEKVLLSYWPHARPYGDAGILRQNTLGQAEILSLIARFRDAHGDASATPRHARNRAKVAWERLVKDVEWVLVEMPLPRLQVLGASEQRFIYQIRWERDGISRKEFLDGSTFHNQIQFVGGAEWHLVRLAGLLRPLLQREWAARVAAINRLPEARLEAFLFGASRQALRALEPSLRDLQEGRCFYCDESLGNRAAVDHFIPWARHPDDAVENLVIADARCNGAKSDHLAAVAHLDRWDARARDQSTALADIASRHDWEQGDGRSLRTARAIYSRLAPAVPLWLRGRIFVPFDRNEFDRTLT